MGRCVHEADEKWGGESKGADEKWGGESVTRCTQGGHAAGCRYLLSTGCAFSKFRRQCSRASTELMFLFYNSTVNKDSCILYLVNLHLF